MPEYTVKHGLASPLAADRIKDAAAASKLANDIKALALTADAAITAEGIRAEEAAYERTKWNRGVIPNGSDVREFLYGSDKDRQWRVLSGDACASMVQASLPEDLQRSPKGFTVVVETLGNGVILTLKTYDVYGDAAYQCNSAPTGTVGWTNWNKYKWDEGADSQFSSQSSSGFKTLPLILTAGSGGDEPLAPTSANAEYDVALSQDIHVSRWRFAIRDGNPRWGTKTAQTITLSNISFAGVAKLSSMTTRADGAISFSPWFTGALGNLKFDYVAQQGPRYIVGGGRINGTRRTTMPFELWIECEIPASTPAVGLMGDSNSIAVNATIPIHDAWMAQYCRDKGFFPVLYGHSGDAMVTSGDASHYKWTRWDHLDRPDVVVHANGANDIPSTEGGITLAELQALAQAEWEVSAQKISKNRHVALIKSRASGINNTLRLGLNAWYKTMPDPIREWHDIASPVTTNDTGGLLPQYISSDNIHMNTAGHTAIKNFLIAAGKVMTTRSAGFLIDTDGVPYF